MKSRTSSPFPAAPATASAPGNGQKGRAGRSPASSHRARAATSEEIYERVLGAIVEHRLPPGTKLVEEKLAAVFGVSRTKIRQALGRLAHEHIVTVFPKRGAFVARPTLEEARQVFEARRVIEPALVRRVAEAATGEQVERLRAHLAEEAQARARSDRRAIIRLSGDFHQLLAEIAGNAPLARTMRELESLTCLIIILYDAPNLPSCPSDEHGAIVDAVAGHDPDRAVELMLVHLGHVQATLDLHSDADAEIDLESVFA